MAGQGIDVINKSIRPITNLALIGDNDLDTIADLTTNIMAGYDINPDSMNSVADVIASTISRSNVNIIETAESFKMAAGTLRMAGIDFTEASAAIGLLGNMGLKGTMSGTSLRAIATRLASQPKSARDVVDRLGINFKEKVNIYGNEVERFRPLADIFEDLNKAGATLEDMHKIFGVRGGNAGMMFLQNYEKLRELTSHNIASQGISQELAKVKQETTKGLWYQMTSQFTETFMQVYERIEPQIQRIMRQFLAKFKTEDFTKGLLALSNALLDMFNLLGNIASWIGQNFGWLGPTVFTGMAAAKLFKLAGAVTNLGVAMGFLGKKAAAMQGLQTISALTGFGGMGGMGLRSVKFADKRAMVTALRGAGITGKGTMVKSMGMIGGGMRGAVGRGAVGAFATQVATGRGLVGAGASLGALGTTAIVAAGAFSVFAAAVGLVAYKTWKMHETHRAVIEDLEKKEEFSFPSLDALYASLNKAFTAAKDTKSALDELTLDKNLIEETAQPMGVLSKRGWRAFFNAFAHSEGYVEGLETYTYADAYQDNINEALTTLGRQEAVAMRSQFFGELGRYRDAISARSYVETIRDTYGQDISKVDTSLYTTYKRGDNVYSSYNPETGEGLFKSGLKKTLTVAEAMKTGAYVNYVNKTIVPKLEMYGKEYQDILSSQSHAEEVLAKMGLSFEELSAMGFARNTDGVWTQKSLSKKATDDEKVEHLKNYRTVHNELVAVAGKLRQHWGNNGEIATNILNAAGFQTHLFSNEPDRVDNQPWNRPGISGGGEDDGGAGGNYSGTGKMSSAAPKQVIVNIPNLLSVETIELLRSENGKLPEIQDLKEQMAQALIDTVHDFDASWHG